MSRYSRNFTKLLRNFVISLDSDYFYCIFSKLRKMKQSEAPVNIRFPKLTKTSFLKFAVINGVFLFRKNLRKHWKPIVS